MSGGIESAVSPDELPPSSHSPHRPPPPAHAGGGQPGEAGDHATPPAGGGPPYCLMFLATATGMPATPLNSRH
eukprot:3114446-Alexandrium_andersonii.AAC.1